MSVQSVGNNANNPYVNALTNDFSSLQNSLKSLATAQGSGNQDQVTLSENAIQKAMTQFQTDLASLSQSTQTSTQSTYGHHHHHHHHGVNAANASNSIAGNSTLASSGYNLGTQSQNNVNTVNLTA